MKKIDSHCATCNSRSDSIFCHLSEKGLQDLEQYKSTKHFPRGQILFSENDQPKGVFCVRTGKIKLYKRGDEGREAILRIASSSDVLGFRSILMNEPYRLTAEVLEDAQICFIDRSFFMNLIQKNPDLAFQIIYRLGEELESTENRISDFLNVDVRKRFIRLLLTLQKTYGVSDMTGILLNVRLTRQEMGEMVGAAPETIIRILSDLENEKYISMDGKKIKICDINGLAREASIDN